MAEESAWKNYHKIQYTEARPYKNGEDLSGITLPSEGYTPKEGDMVLRNPRDRDDSWLVTKEFFEQNYESMEFSRGQTREVLPPDTGGTGSAAESNPLMGNKRMQF